VALGATVEVGVGAAGSGAAVGATDTGETPHDIRSNATSIKQRLRARVLRRFIFSLPGSLPEPLLLFFIKIMLIYYSILWVGCKGCEFLPKFEFACSVSSLTNMGNFSTSCRPAQENVI
jgi:hypothetical protein